MKIMVDLTIRATLDKRIRTKNPLLITNKLMHVLSVARVGILLNFANFGNMGLSHRLMLPKSL